MQWLFAHLNWLVVHSLKSETNATTYIYIINVKYTDLTFQLKVLKHSSVKILDYEAIPPCKTKKAVNSFNVVTRNHQKNDM